jgi:hypothetical protein
VEDLSPASILAFFMKNHFTIEMLQDEMLDVIDSGMELDAPLRNEAEHLLYEEFHTIFSPQIYSIYISYASKSPSSLPDSTGDSTMSLRHILYLLDDLSLLGSSRYQMEISEVIRYFSDARPENDDDSLYWAEMELVPVTLFDTIFHFAKKIAGPYLEQIGIEQIEVEREASVSAIDLDQRLSVGAGELEAIDADPKSKRRTSNMPGSTDSRDGDEVRARSNTSDRGDSNILVDDRVDSSTSKGKYAVEFAVDCDEVT